MKRLLSLLLALVMVLTLAPAGIFAEAEETEAPAPAEETASQETAASEDSEGSLPETTAVPETEAETTAVPETEAAETGTAAATEETAATVPEETAPSGTEETEAPEPETTAQEDQQILVTAWTWDDPDELLQDGTMTLYGVGPDNPLTLEQVSDMLPQAILLESRSVPISWKSDSFSPGAAGSFLFEALLPEGYVLSQEAPALLVTVIIPSQEPAAPETDGASQDTNDELSIRIIDRNRFNNKELFDFLAKNYPSQYQLDTFFIQELQAITSLDVSGLNLGSLEDLYLLSNLEVLKCDNAGLYSLNVHCFPKLRELSCSGNPISALDLSGNPGLLKLNCSDTEISQLDLSKQQKLTDLNCRSTKLSCLDLRSCPELANVTADNCHREVDAANGKLDLAALPGFDLSMAYDWQNGRTEGGFLSPIIPGRLISYKYHMTDQLSQVFTLRINQGIAVSPVSFPDPSFCSWVSQNVDLDKDSLLSQAECDAVRDMVITDLNIKELGGIELFPNLQKLDCSYNSITVLDLRQNPALIELNTQDNPIGVLHIENCSRLTHLNLDSNSLIHLDLKGNPALQHLSAIDSPIKTIDVTGCPELTHVDLHGCRILESPDFSKNPRLQHLNLLYTFLHDLYLRGNPELEYLDISTFQSEFLDLSCNMKLKTLHCNVNLTAYDLSHNPLLEELDLSGSSITSLDLSHNPNLKNINLANCGRLIYLRGGQFDLTSLPGFDPLKASNWEGGHVENGILTPDALDTEIYYDYDLGNGRTSRFFVIFREKVKLPQISHNDAAFDQFLMDQFGHGLLPLSQEQLDSITSISLVDYPGCKELSTLHYFRNLETLNLGQHKLTRLDLSRNPKLREVICSNGRINTLILGENANLTYLDCSSNPLDSLDTAGLTGLKKLFCGDCGLKELSLTNNTGLEVLNCTNNQLETLDLCDMSLLTDLYCSNNPLHSLYLSNNGNLKKLIASDCALTRLNVSGCTTLRELNCSNNQLSQLNLQTHQILQKLFCQNNRLTTLNLQGLPMLQVLNCSDNLLETLDTQKNRKLESLVAHRNRLYCLNLDWNPKLKNLGTLQNLYETETDDGTLDLSALPGFQMSRAYGWSGGTLNGTILTPNTEGSKITYRYRCGNGKIVSLAMKIHNKNELFKIAAANMTLGNSLDMHFYVNNSDLHGMGDHYAVITRSYGDGRADTYELYPQAGWQPYGANMHRFTYRNLAAKEMADTLKIQIFRQDGTPASEVKIDSIRDYCMRNFDKQADMLKTMMADMLNYGAQAQMQFNYNVSDLANNRMTASHQAWATKNVTMADQRQKGPSYAGSTLKLESRLMMDLYFTNVTADQYAVLSYVDHTGRTHEKKVPYSQMKPNGSYRIVTVDDMVIADCRQLITCKLYNGKSQEVGSVVDSPESYCARMQGKGGIYMAIMKFSTSAHYYLHNR